MNRSARTLTVTLAAAALMTLGGGVASAAEVPEIPRLGPDGSIDQLVDGLTCEGPLGGLISQLADCEPEDEPPFTSVPDEEFSTAQE